MIDYELLVTDIITTLTLLPNHSSEKWDTHSLPTSHKEEKNALFIDALITLYILLYLCRTYGEEPQAVS